MSEGVGQGGVEAAGVPSKALLTKAVRTKVVPARAGAGLTRRDSRESMASSRVVEATPVAGKRRLAGNMGCPAHSAPRSVSAAGQFSSLGSARFT